MTHENEMTEEEFDYADLELEFQLELENIIGFDAMDAAMEALGGYRSDGWLVIGHSFTAVTFAAVAAGVFSLPTEAGYSAFFVGSSEAVGGIVVDLADLTRSVIVVDLETLL